MKTLLLSTFLSLVAFGASSAEKTSAIDTLYVSTSPEMHCSGCENRIKKNIRFVKGVKKIETSIPDQTVTIIYDTSKSEYKDFIAAFKKIGYEIEPKQK